MSDYQERIAKALSSVFAKHWDTELPGEPLFHSEKAIAELAVQLERVLRAAGLKVATSTHSLFGNEMEGWAERTALRAGTEELEKP